MKLHSLLCCLTYYIIILGFFYKFDDFFSCPQFFYDFNFAAIYFLSRIQLLAMTIMAMIQILHQEKHGMMKIGQLY